MSSKWSRNQKLLLAGLVVAIISLFAKMEISINILSGELEKLKIKQASISRAIIGNPDTRVGSDIVLDRGA